MMLCLSAAHLVFETLSLTGLSCPGTMGWPQISQHQDYKTVAPYLALTHGSRGQTQLSTGKAEQPQPQLHAA